MNSVIEKEKKLNLALAKLKNLNLKNPDVKKNIENLSSQKNQLEIEKDQITKSFESLEEENLKLKSQLKELKINYEISKKKENLFTEKIDELNQETDSLLEEIDKWQM